MESVFSNQNPFLKAVIDTAVDGIIIINDRGIIQMANEAVIALFGYSKEEIVGENVKILMPSEHQRNHDQYIANYHQTGIEKIIGIGREVEGRKKDGEQFPFKLGVSRFENNGNVFYTGIIHDLTLQKENERKIIELNRQLEQKVDERTAQLTEVVNRLISTNNNLKKEATERTAVQEKLMEAQRDLEIALERERELSQLKSRFVSMASHEFRTPLTSVLSSAQLLRRYTKEGQQDKREKHIKRIESATKNLTGILNDFLSLSKLEDGKVELEPEEFVVCDLINEIFEELEGMKKEQQQLIYEPAEKNRTVTLDPRLLKNVLFNLLSNAIKYSEDGKRIWLKCGIENHQLTIAVKDEGVGIPEEEQKHLFSRFFRAKNVANVQGTGLGLTIVKRYLDLLNGDISFESATNEGTTFFVKIDLEE